ncbi:MAG: hypothetical protein U9P72_07930 [Campylobacterota bacterium]|nr:hypothetical protein [Campylobacterota bacterium]
MRISSSKPTYSVKSTSRINKTHITNEILRVEETHTIREINRSISMIEMSEPELFPIPKQEKDKFINDALYKNENRLLQVIINTIYKTSVGKEFYPYLKAFSESKKIYFTDSSTQFIAHAIFRINSMEKNNVEIIVAKDNCIPFLSASLIHEISHYFDFRELFVSDKKSYTRFETEVKAFANSYRFLIEGGFTNDYWYDYIEQERKWFFEKCYDYTYNGSIEFRSSLYEELLMIGYENLNDCISL